MTYFYRLPRISKFCEFITSLLICTNEVNWTFGWWECEYISNDEKLVFINISVVGFYAYIKKYR